MSFFLKKFSIWTLLYVIFLIIMLGVASYLVLGQEAKHTVTQRILDQQHLIARAEASNTEIFFERIGDAVATLAQLKSIERRDSDAGSDLDSFMKQRLNSGLIGGVILTDKDGIVRLNSNILGTKDVGQSLADREYFAWAKNQAKKGDYYVSQPVVSRTGATKGQMIVPVISPVYQNGAFSGIVAVSVKLKPLVDNFFGLMKVGKHTKTKLLSREGELIYSNSSPEAIGSDISEIFPDDQVLTDKINQTLIAKEEGQFATDKHLVAYSPVELSPQNWLLVISSRINEVDEQMRPVYFRQISMLVLTALTFLLFASISVNKNPD